MRDRARHLTGPLAGWFVLLWVLLGFAAAAQAAASDALPPSNRVDIDLGATAWKFVVDQDNIAFSTPQFDDSGWNSKGVPESPSDDSTFLNLPSGGGEGQLTGNVIWYRKHFKIDPSYSNRKILVEFEGAHTGARVFINGTFLKGNSAINPNATHVVGFVPFEVDITNYVHFDGTDNVIAVETARNADFFESPSFSGAFRFGQDDTGLFRHVWMHITDKVHIPENVYSVLQTWGTYVATTGVSSSSATVRVQTNVLNENPVGQAAQVVTLTTQIVDAQGNVVQTAQDTKTIASNAGPALTPTLFDQTMTVQNPILWYPNNSPSKGGPYLYHVIHTVSVNGAVVDVKETPLGIRVITWDNNFPYFNGVPHYLWGASGRYDYPALGSAVPDNLKWNDLYLLAQAGGSLWRPGHSSEGPVFLDAADAYGIMVMQPSGDGENGFGAFCDSVRTQNCASPTNWTLKQELHRDMIVNGRNHPSVLAWEADNGATSTDIAQQLKQISIQWDPINTRAQADRTPNPANGDLLGCSGDGCDIGVKNQFPNSPSVGSEYWGNGVGRAKYDFELAFAAPYVNNWVHSVLIKSMGIAHWYLADTPGEIVDQVDGTANDAVRSNGASMMDEHRLPRLLYYIYEAIWTPFERKPVVKLAYHWNRSGPITVNAFSNCPSVRLLVNDQPAGPDQTPNPTTSDSSSNLTQSTTLLPGQVHWDNVQWVSGTVKAICLNSSGQAVAQDMQVTAGAADHIALTVEPGTPKPDGTVFDLRANGSDAAVITARVVDANGNLVPDASPEITFSVPSTDTAGEYRGGSDHYVTAGSGAQPDQSFHAPGDHRVFAEGGMTRIVVRTTFTPGTVHVTATAAGLGSGATSFDVLPVVSQQTFDGKDLVIGQQQATGLQIVTQPVDQTVTRGQQATFTVLAAGAAPLQFVWTKNGETIDGATGFSYTTSATQASDDNATIGVTVSNSSGSVSSNPVKLHVVEPAVPQITTQPAAQTVVAGNSTSFTVGATGSPTLTYQWLKNGQPIADASAQQQTYITPAVSTQDDGAVFSVVVTNSAGTATSNGAKLTVGTATPPTIVSQPRSLSVPVGQSVGFSVVATGSDPLTYTWTRNGTTVLQGVDKKTLSIVSAAGTDSGEYVVTVTNAGGTASSTPFTLSVSGADNSNLAIGALAQSSLTEGDNLAARFVNDGDTTTRWGSAIGDDNAYVQLDFHTPKTFDQVVFVWENAYAKQYNIEVSDDGDNWTIIKQVTNGTGGNDPQTFPSTTHRYVRMQGVQRATNFGYSLFEMEVFDTPTCGAQTERYTLNPAQSGTWQSPFPQIPSGPFPATVKDNVSGLTWQTVPTTFPGQGDQFTQTVAEQYCASVGMRVPTQAEALTIAGPNVSQCAFPGPWTTWTLTPDPSQSGRAFTVSSDGQSVSQIANNTPVAALCVSGPTSGVPVIKTQPASQTAPAGQNATFTVLLDDSVRGPYRYEWSENGKVVGITTTNSFTTPPVTTDDNGAVFTVRVSNAGGTTASQAATLTVGAAGGGGDGGNGGTGGDGGNGGTGGDGGNGGNGGNGGTPPQQTPTADLAIGATVTASGSENDGLLPQNAVDGDINSRWSSAFNDQQWLQLDLGTAQTVDRVVIDWQDSFGVAYTIDTSADGQNWQNAVTQNNGQGGEEDLRFAARTARYIRFTGTKRATQFGYSMFEFGVYNTANTPQFGITASATGSGTVSPAGSTQVYQGGTQTYTFTPADGFAVTGVQVDGQNVGLVNSYTFNDVRVGHTISVAFGPSSAAVNLALGSTATSGDLENDGYPASNAVDGNMDTRWSSAFSDPQAIQLNFGTVRTFNRVVLFWQDAHAVQYQIQTSNDGQQWTTVFTQNNGQGGVEDIHFDTVSAQYVRMLGTKRNTGYGYSLYEFQVYNVPVAPAITTPPASVTVNQGDTATFSVVASGTAPLTYKWFKNGSLVATTTVPSYTTPATVASDSGATFSVIVSNAAGDTPQSGGATLSVNAPVSGGSNGNTGSGDTGTDNGSGAQPGTGTGDDGSTGGTPTQRSANLALNAVVQSSGAQDDGDTAVNAVDGNLGSRWSSNFADDAWMTVDLGTPTLFDRVVLRWENAYGKAYVLESSNDNQTWTPLVTQNAGTGGTEDISVPATTARYVRMQGVQRATQYGYSLYEFEVYNSAATPKLVINATSSANGSISPSGQINVNQAGSQTFTAVPAAGFGIGSLTVDGQEVGAQTSYTFNNVTAAHSISVNFVPLAASVNLALHQPATASGVENDGTPASAATDGDLNTRWSSAFVDDSWLAVDLGTAQTFDRVVLSWENAHASSYVIETSNDNTNWSTAFTNQNSNGGVEDDKFTSPVTARYVRMHGIKRSTGYGYSLFEMAVYNSGTSASTPPQQGVSLIEQPASQSVPVGQNGHFAVLPSGSGPFTYQWRRNGTAISGATTRTYDTAATTTADDGAVFSVVVTGPNGPSTSNDATLSVDSTMPNYPITPGFINVDLANNTKGAFTDDKVFVEIIGRDPQSGNFVWLKPDGTIMPMLVSDNDAPGHLTSGSDNYTNYAFTLAQAKSIKVPHISSARMYVSLGSPVFIKVLTDANNNIGFAGPNPQNQTDANVNVVFDWIEFDNGGNTLFINTTQVDEFSIPLVEDVYGNNRTTHMQTGITMGKADIFAAYAKEVSTPFQSELSGNIRIMAPAKSTFDAGQPNAHYFDAYIDQIWQQYANQDLVLNLFGNRRFIGRTQGDQFVFTEVNLNNGGFVGGTYTVNKPTTQDVLLGAGNFATGDSTTLQIEAQMCAAFNRHVMEDVSKWPTPTAWWGTSPTNEYARFFHDHSVSGLAYGFAYDDVSNGSSSIVAPQPEYIKLGIGW